MYGVTNETAAEVTSQMGKYVWEETSRILATYENPKIVVSGKNISGIPSTIQVSLFSERSLDGFKISDNLYFRYDSLSSKLYLVSGDKEYVVYKEYGRNTIVCDVAIDGTYEYLGVKRIYQEPYHYELVHSNSPDAYPKNGQASGKYYYTYTEFINGNDLSISTSGVELYPDIVFGGLKGLTVSNPDFNKIESKVEWTTPIVQTTWSGYPPYPIDGHADKSYKTVNLANIPKCFIVSYAIISGYGYAVNYNLYNNGTLINLIPNQASTGKFVGFGTSASQEINGIVEVTTVKEGETSVTIGGWAYLDTYYTSTSSPAYHQYTGGTMGYIIIK